jgi:hypothetical protein
MHLLAPLPGAPTVLPAHLHPSLCHACLLAQAAASKQAVADLEAVSRDIGALAQRLDSQGREADEKLAGARWGG